jgi:hypothetical protein
MPFHPRPVRRQSNALTLLMVATLGHCAMVPILAHGSQNSASDTATIAKNQASAIAALHEINAA